MKILQITYSLASGGAERFVVDMCNELAKNNNNEVHILVIRDLKIARNNLYLPSLSDKVICHNLGTIKGLCWKSLKGVYKTIINIKPDIVHAHCDLTLLYLPAILYQKTKYVHTLHNLANKNIVSHKLRKIQQILYKSFVFPITISNICQNSYIEYYKLNNSLCITNGRAPIETTDKLIDVKKEIQSFTKSDDVPVFVHVARYAEQKNQKLLFETFKQIKCEGYKFLLLVIGAGYEETEYYKLNGSDEFKILGRKDNVGDYIKCSDYFVLSSLWEGLPLALLEAMSMGCIPISTPAGGVVDVIKNGVNGYLSPTFEKKDFYNTIMASLKNKIKKDYIINDYKHNYTMEVCVDKYYNVYESLLRSK